MKQNVNFLISLRIERQDGLGNILLHEEDLKCPIHLPGIFLGLTGEQKLKNSRGVFLCSWGNAKVALFLTLASALDTPSNSICQEVQREDRLHCTSQLVSLRECEEKACYYTHGDPQIRCCYGNTVTACCTPDGHFSIAVSRDVTLPSLILESVHHVVAYGNGCVPVTKTPNTFVHYNFTLSACGTAFQVRINTKTPSLKAPVLEHFSDFATLIPIKSNTAQRCLLDHLIITGFVCWCVSYRTTNMLVCVLQFHFHYQRFVISTFAFVDSASHQVLGGPVFFHCSAAACVSTVMESCMPHCPRVVGNGLITIQVLFSSPPKLLMIEFLGIHPQWKLRAHCSWRRVQATT
ncbi:zona pellucida sperm-binding protein 4-like [Anolis carolinensis]|uniref:zona pellucida sperm-binding protein 4-like n=1 Tax=Anolis carolinensis TaxID=28377 RepID=UPI002F2B7935